MRFLVTLSLGLVLATPAAAQESSKLSTQDYLRAIALRALVYDAGCKVDRLTERQKKLLVSVYAKDLNHEMATYFFAKPITDMKKLSVEERTQRCQAYPNSLGQ